MIPFPGYISKQEQKVKPQGSVTSQPVNTITSFKKEVKSVSKPTGVIGTSTVSIKKTLEELKNPSSEIIIDLANMPAEAFEYDQLKMAIRQFAFKMKEEGSDTLHIALTKRDPKIIDKTNFEILVDNQVQFDMMNYKIQDLLTYVRTSLRNYQVAFKVIIVDESSFEEGKVMSKREIFELMARKNSNLFSLQKTFNLVIDN